MTKHSLRILLGALLMISGGAVARAADDHGNSSAGGGGGQDRELYVSTPQRPNEPCNQLRAVVKDALNQEELRMLSCTDERQGTRHTFNCSATDKREQPVTINPEQSKQLYNALAGFGRFNPTFKPARIPMQEPPTQLVFAESVSIAGDRASTECRVHRGLDPIF